MSRTRTHQVARLLVTTLLAGSLASAANATRVAAATTNHVVNSVIGVAYRNSPHDADKKQPIHGAFDGWTITVFCQAWGDPMGPRANHIWDFIQDARGEQAWIPDAWVDTPAPANQYSMGQCAAPAPPPPPLQPTCNPQLPGSPCYVQPQPVPVPSAVDKAVSWASAKQQVSPKTHDDRFDGRDARNNQYNGWCLQFVFDAYASGGKNIGSATTAVAWWNAHTAGRHAGDVNPPRGALVFWGATSTNPAGHVALALGDGTAVSTGERSWVDVHVLSIADRNRTRPYLGWIMP